MYFKSFCLFQIKLLTRTWRILSPPRSISKPTSHSFWTSSQAKTRTSAKRFLAFFGLLPLSLNTTLDFITFVICSRNEVKCCKIFAQDLPGVGNNIDAFVHRQLHREWKVLVAHNRALIPGPSTRDVIDQWINFKSTGS